MKTLKFSNNLIPDILSGKKNVTWRCFDDKGLKEGDEVLFLEHESKNPFAKVILIEVKEKTFTELNEDDKRGHEEFKSDEEMYKTYSEYYKTEITPDTLVKIIKFKLLEKNKEKSKKELAKAVKKEEREDQREEKRGQKTLERTTRWSQNG